MIKANSPIRRVPTALALLAVGLALVVLAGCGGESDEDGPSAASDQGAVGATSTTSNPADADTVETSSLTKAEFDNRAEEICIQNSKNALPAIVRYITREASSSDKGEAELAAEAVQKFFLPKIQAQIDEIRALGAPAGDEQQVEAFLAAMQQGVATLQDKDQLSLETGVDATLQGAGNLMHAYGLESCL